VFRIDVISPKPLEDVLPDGFAKMGWLNGSSGLCGTAAPRAYQERCGYTPRLPLLLISPFAKQNHVDSTLTDTTPILRFSEDNWNLGRLGDQSFDAMAGSILNLFNFNGPPAPVFLDPATGLVVSGQ
jgi:phospholipase C